MARGWESKSVEAQQEEASDRSASNKPRLTREEAERQREIGNLRLSVCNVQQQLDRSPDLRRRAVLEQAKSDLERRLAELGR
jgi:hypothetical protein